MRERGARRAFQAFVLALCLAMTGNGPVHAASCYAPEEAQAERMLRLHSELMVLAVTCRYSSKGHKLGDLYADFTRRNIALFHDAEETLTRHYETGAPGQGVARLDTLRTRLANEFGQKIAAQSAPVFCARRRDRGLTLYSATEVQIRGEATRIPGALYEPLCRKEGHVAPARGP